MKKYVVLYYIKDENVSGTNLTQMTLTYDLNHVTIRRAENRLAKTLNVPQVVILTYMEIEVK